MCVYVRMCVCVCVCVCVSVCVCVCVSNPTPSFTIHPIVVDVLLCVFLFCFFTEPGGSR